eukprot:1703_1
MYYQRKLLDPGRSFLEQGIQDTSTPIDMSYRFHDIPLEYLPADIDAIDRQSHGPVATFTVHFVDSGAIEVAKNRFRIETWDHLESADLVGTRDEFGVPMVLAGTHHKEKQIGSFQIEVDLNGQASQVLRYFDHTHGRHNSVHA